MAISSIYNLIFNCQMELAKLFILVCESLAVCVTKRFAKNY